MLARIRLLLTADSDGHGMPGASGFRPLARIRLLLTDGNTSRTNRKVVSFRPLARVLPKKMMDTKNVSVVTFFVTPEAIYATGLKLWQRFF